MSETATASAATGTGAGAPATTAATPPVRPYLSLDDRENDLGRGLNRESAKRLLEGQNATIDRVAEQVGYRDTRAFIRAFGAVAGVSPGQYRQKFRER